MTGHYNLCVNQFDDYIPAYFTFYLNALSHSKRDFFNNWTSNSKGNRNKYAAQKKVYWHQLCSTDQTLDHCKQLLCKLFKSKSLLFDIETTKDLVVSGPNRSLFNPSSRPIDCLYLCCLLLHLCVFVCEGLLRITFNHWHSSLTILILFPWVFKFYFICFSLRFCVFVNLKFDNVKKQHSGFSSI